jgi:hypothetical protein
MKPITMAVIYKNFEVDDIPEFHHRIFAGTTLLKNLELITNDLIVINSRFISAVW